MLIFQMVSWRLEVSGLVPGWSRFSQGLIIGVVRDISTLESNPTRKTVRIDVLNDPQRLDHFLIVSPKSNEGEAP